MKHPDKFLSVVFHESGGIGDDLALCAGFERGKWRNDQFADHIIEWLPEFALSYSEINEIGHHNALRIIKRAAKIVYDTEKYGLRGEFGEILLHIAIRQVYKTLPAINKIYYKSSVNETVKGFDAVHVVKKDDGLELWVGETKFYNKVSRAIYDVVKEIVDHLETDYLKSEFILIRNKIDPEWPEAEELRELLHENTSLDKVFRQACIPVLLTYDSEVVKGGAIDKEYESNIRDEIIDAYSSFRNKLNDQYLERFFTVLPITVHVILIPLHEKKELIAALDKRLKALQI
ncbi:HamA C-terminal domain-containing protein [Pseudomonas neuropathica]|uniref:HamA C-terminal domain-containing protein n=1 Tax=Pseudomonas neuropathica TaxID=2730425 RepID=UPI003EBE2B1B